MDAEFGRTVVGSSSEKYEVWPDRRRLTVGDLSPLIHTVEIAEIVSDDFPVLHLINSTFMTG